MTPVQRSLSPATRKYTPSVLVDKMVAPTVSSLSIRSSNSNCPLKTTAMNASGSYIGEYMFPNWPNVLLSTILSPEAWILSRCASSLSVVAAARSLRSSLSVRISLNCSIPVVPRAQREDSELCHYIRII